PQFGASLHILKVEIGGDAQSTIGTESSHMHDSWDENYQRGYEWWIMKEAKKRNPDILLAGLPWAFPGWLGFAWWPYQNTSRTADYIVRWIEGAAKVHNLTINVIGIWNEKPYDVGYVKVLRKTLDTRGFKDVQIIAADQIGIDSWDIAGVLKHDREFNESVSMIGGHYPGTTTSDEAKHSGKPLWASEDYSTRNDETGAGCMARILNQNYVNGLMTSTIAWNLLDSYYNDTWYNGHGLMTANQPWSGHYEVSGPIWTTAHTTQFTQVGWHYLPHGRGVGTLKYGGSYVSLVSPDKKQLNIIIETMDTTMADFCVNEPQHPSKVFPQNVTFHLNGTLRSIESLQLWYTHLGLGKQESIYFKHLGEIKVTGGVVSLPLTVNSVYTLTTLKTGRKGSVQGLLPAPKPFPRFYKDNFEEYSLYEEAANFAQQVGVFEIRPAEGMKSTNYVSGGKVLRQVLLYAPIHWCPSLMVQPIALIGDYNWRDSSVSVDVRVGQVNATDGVFVAARVNNSGCTAFLAKGIYFFLLYDVQQWQMSHDLARTQAIQSGDYHLQPGKWYNIALKVNGNFTAASIDGKTVFSKEVPVRNKNGFAAIGTDSLGLADFDNFVLAA
ncbi:Galactocerebrosidase, partial [Lamellibrachia satsuma]